MMDDRRVNAGRDITGTVITGDIQELHLTLPRLPEIPAPEPARPPEIAGFVGRRDELAFYKQRLDSTHLAVISGMAGVGKTALAANLARQYAQLDPIFWHAFHEGEGIEVVIWKLAGFLAWNGRAELWQMLQGARITGGQPPPPETLFDYLLEMMRGSKYLLCLDDFQYVDQDPLLNQLVERLRGALVAGDLAIVITTRRIPAFIETAESASLDGLSRSDVKQLVEARGLALAPDQVEALHQRTAGNAQFLNMAMHALQFAGDPQQMIRSMAETEDIERYLMNEVDEHLSETQRRVLEAVAVLLGYPGTADAIESVLGGSNVRRALRELCDHYLLIARQGEQGRQYTQHALLQAFYYQLMDRARRQAMHRRAGEFYEKAEPDPLRAGLHYERAEEYPKAARLITANTWELVNRGQARAVQHLLERFTADRLDPLEWVEVNLARGRVYALIGEGRLAGESFQIAHSTAESLPDTQKANSLMARACLGMGELLEQEDPQEALHWLHQGLSRLGESENSAKASLHIQIGSVQLNRGDYLDAQEALERGLKLLPENSLAERSKALTNLGVAYFSQGDANRARQYTLNALEISQRLNNHFQSIDTYNNLGIYRFSALDWEGAISDWNRAVDLANRLGSGAYRTAPEGNLASAYIKTGQEENALFHLENVLGLARKYNMRLFESVANYLFATLNIRSGDWPACLEHLGEAERIAEEIDAQGAFPEIYSIWAELHLARGESRDALLKAEKAVKLARELGDNLQQGASLRVLGQVWIQDGFQERAVNAFSESVDLLSAQDAYEAALTKFQWGKALLAGPQSAEGRQLLEQSRLVFQQVGARRELIELEKIDS
jgi:ATP/maltotriose-dependent transcriptional regulator MalT